MTFLENIKSIPIIDYAERIGFTVIRKGKYYSLKEHDSVMINSEKNCFWRNSVFQKGQRGGAGSIIDFAIEFQKYNNAKIAMRELAQLYGIEGNTPPVIKAPSFNNILAVKKEKKEEGEFTLPKKVVDNNKAVIRYLCQERHIDISVVRYFLAKKMLYADKRKNCVFVSNKFACIRSTGSQRFAIDVEGCDYNECFYFRGSEKANTLIVAESVIDIMSIMTQLVRERKRYTNYCYLSLSGTGKWLSLFNHLEKDTSIRSICLCLDNDKAGWSATESIIKELYDRGMDESHKIYHLQSPSGKDWNEYIVNSSLDS